MPPPVLMRVTAEQKEILTASATRVGLDLSTWLLMLRPRAARSDE